MIYRSRSEPSISIQVLSFDDGTVTYRELVSKICFETNRSDFQRTFEPAVMSSAQKAGMHVLRRETMIDAPLEEVFEFFSKADNLERLTPSTLKFKILTPPPISMKAGTLIDYRLSLFGVPFKWRTRIEVYDPPHEFVDLQLKGPYKLWRHTHRFSESDGQTLMEDEVQYSSPGWILEPLINALFVGPQVEKIFDFRTKSMEREFPGRAVQKS